ncbi:MAG TPA: CYTH domain-containing protein [Rhabdochlamydiaceae bacterium]|nr:CYTH domain-containing protein [Rhabdochlamydiaceae bacterium]
MIEVERKIFIDESQLKTIEESAQFLESIALTDTYYDTADYRFTTSDIWLRERNCVFELKIGIKGMGGAIDRYLEIRDEDEILKKLGLENEHSLSKALNKAAILPYASFQTIRRKYRLQKFTLDLDLAYFDDFIYRVLEIEVLVEDETKMGQAEKEITQIINTLGLTQTRPVKAKLIQYLFQKNPSHYQALLTAGIVRG